MTHGRADLIVVGRIATLAGEDGFGWVEAIAIRDARVIAAGNSAEVASLAGPRTKRIDVPAGHVVLPGLTDAHLHLADASLAASRVDLAPAGNPEEALALLEPAASVAGRPDAWLLGQRWDAARWGRWPLAAELDRVAPTIPAFLWSHDHHAAWVNSAALARAGIGPRTQDPPGGLIRRLPDGTPSGTLHEQAVRLVADLVPAVGPDELDAAIVAYSRELLRLGIVAVHDPGPTGLDPHLERGFASYARLDSRGALPLRVHASVRADSLGLALERGLSSGTPLVSGPGAGADARARVGWLKLFADGAFGSRTAALREPYEAEDGRDAPVGGERGMFVTEPDELRRLVALAGGGGVATQIHAIGDAAVAAALDAFEPPRIGRASSGPRPRIEHVQLLDPADADRFASLGVAASVQPGHLVGDAAMARAALGPRADELAYPLASLASLGVLVPFGSDAPVESPDPWPGVAMAVTRRSPTWDPDVPAFGPAEAIDLPRAVRAASLDAPLVAAENDRGRLVPGHRADFIVVAGEMLQHPATEGRGLESLRPTMVVMDAEVVFEE